MPPLLEVADLHKRFGNNTALSGANLAIAAGEKACIVGPSGSGKTTLLRCMNLLVQPTRGRLSFRGDVIGEWPGAPPTTDLGAYRRQIGMVFQHFELFPHLTALDNITLAPRHLLHEPKQAAEERAIGLLRQIGLDDVARQHPHTLSGGQKQRIAIARALVMNPALMLFDEPTSALDPEMVGEVLRLMATLAKGGMTMVIVTHELGFAREIADHIVVMEAGVIVEQGPTTRMFESPDSTRTREILQLAGGWRSS